MYVFETDEGGGRSRFYLAVIEPGASGMPAEAIVGELTGGPELELARFVPNEVFARFLAWAIARHAARCPGIVDEAARQRDGHVYVIDRRAPGGPNDPVSEEDIIGAVEVVRGKITKYIGSPNYRAFGTAGLMQLDPWLHERLLEELRALPAK
jgi:hypothetical protein